jgi:hypothetical protein
MAGSLVISTLNNDTGVLATQNGMNGIAKAWGQFNTYLGASTIGSSFNISSFVRTQTGYYSIYLITPMASDSFVANFNSWQNNSTLDVNFNIVGGTAGRIDVRTQEGGIPWDPVSLFFVLHGN